MCVKYGDIQEHSTILRRIPRWLFFPEQVNRSMNRDFKYIKHLCFKALSLH